MEFARRVEEDAHRVQVEALGSSTGQAKDHRRGQERRADVLPDQTDTQTLLRHLARSTNR